MFDKLFGLCKALCVVNAYEEVKQLDCQKIIKKKSGA